jgi:F-type H+-transporting ATPase subunit b
MADFVKRRTAAAEAKIAQAETQPPPRCAPRRPMPPIEVAETILRERMTGQPAQDLIARSLGDVRAKLSA